MDDTISLLQVIPFQSHNLYVTFSKQFKWRLTRVLTNLNGNMGGDTSMVQNAKKMRTPGLILGFRGFKLFSNFGDSCFSLDFETSYVAVFNGLIICGIRTRDSQKVRGYF